MFEILELSVLLRVGLPPVQASLDCHLYSECTSITKEKVMAGDEVLTWELILFQGHSQTLKQIRAKLHEDADEGMMFAIYQKT